MSQQDGPTVYPAGWYADANQPGTERYYDGTAWTEQTRAVGSPATAEGATPTSGGEMPTEPTAKRPWYKRKGFIIPVAIVGGLIVVGAIGSAFGGGGDDATTAAPGNSSVTDSTQEDVVEEPDMVDVPDVVGMTVSDARAAAESAGMGFEAGDAGDNWSVISQDITGEVEDTGDVVLTVTAEEPEPELTLGQENAIGAAESYLDFKGFSRAGLFDQLTSEYGEGFEDADAEFALSYLEDNGLVDWNEEAAESAQSYLDFKSFSRDGLYEQLTSEYGEQFTPEQAEYALKAVGY